MLEPEIARNFRLIDIRLKEIEKSIHYLELLSKTNQRVFVRIEDYFAHFDNRVQNAYDRANSLVRQQ